MSNEADKSASFVQTLNIRESDEGQLGVASLWDCTLWLCARCGSVHVVALCMLIGTVDLHGGGNDRPDHDVCGGESFFVDCEGWRGR